MIFVTFLIKNIFSPVFYSLHLVWVRHEVKEKLLTALPIEQLVKIEKSLNFTHKEFEMEGMMYDVVHTKVYKNSRVLYCYVDSEETKINSSIAKSLSEVLQKNPLSKDIVAKIKAFYSVPLYFEELPSFLIHFCLPTFIINAYLEFRLPAEFLKNTSPPPEVLLGL
jgi:hypothetical protein